MDISNFKIRPLFFFVFFPLKGRSQHALVFMSKFPLQKLQSPTGLAVIPWLIPLHVGLLLSKLLCQFILKLGLIL